MNIDSKIDVLFTYFFPKAIIPYITPVVKIKPLPKIVDIPGANIIAGKARLKQKGIVKFIMLCSSDHKYAGI